MKTLGDLGEVVSKFITYSRDDEMTLPREATICKEFVTALGAYRWSNNRQGAIALVFLRLELRLRAI